jgi:hypothetical protein
MDSLTRVTVPAISASTQSPLLTNFFFADRIDHPALPALMMSQAHLTCYAYGRRRAHYGGFGVLQPRSVAHDSDPARRFRGALPNPTDEMITHPVAQPPPRFAQKKKRVPRSLSHTTTVTAPRRLRSPPRWRGCSDKWSDLKCKKV